MDRKTRGLEGGGGRPEKAQALTRDLVRLRDEPTAFMNRYPSSSALDFTDEQWAACEEALGPM
ncbi:hypothetical protein [Streptomyces sp. NPDC001435]|uniref:hypothetical protein n=1 Tax=Streptomyces sp. NPDC001435 TaxID=3364576 RepID=UPI00368B1460